MYGDFCVRIERAENGYTVSMRDPKIVAANAKRDLKGNGPFEYRDPNREYVFTDKESMTTFLMANLDKALPDDKDKSFETSFDMLTSDDDEKDTPA